MTTLDHTQPRLSKAKLLLLAATAAALVIIIGAVPAHAATFDRAYVITDAQFRASTSMTQAEVQAFLDSMPGVLKTYTASDYAGVRKPASRIIWEAAQAWCISPKVILATLQKEQSLLTLTSPTQKALTEAMGCGIYAGSTNRYPGFGNQVWNGTRKLSTYEVTYGWRSGTAINVSNGSTRITIVPANAATFALYTYTPSVSGQSLFWTVHVRYFGDPRASLRYLPLYRFASRRTGEFLFTSSEVERIRVATRMSGTWAFQGTAFAVDASATGNSTPIYRMYNRVNHSYFYTTSAAEIRSTYLKSGKISRFDATMVKVSTTPGSGQPIYRFYNRRTRSCLITASESEKNRVLRYIRSCPTSGFRYDGIIGYLATFTP